jgi:hypothetical protein
MTEGRSRRCCIVTVRASSRSDTTGDMCDERSKVEVNAFMSKWLGRDRHTGGELETRIGMWNCW